jgi:hypothetical protein
MRWQTITAVLAASTSVSLGQVYEFSLIEDGQDLLVSGAAGGLSAPINDFVLRYDAASEVLSGQIGYFTNLGFDEGDPAFGGFRAFALVVNGGGEPADGEAAVLYFDATDPAEPLISVFAYGDWLGSFADGSGAVGVQPPVPLMPITAPYIATVQGSQDAVSSDPQNSALTFTFRLPASAINAAVSPMLPDGAAYTGVAFGETVGFWLQTIYELNGPVVTHYNDAGLLVGIDGSIDDTYAASAFDVFNRPTRLLPTPCNRADLSDSFGVLDTNDITDFLLFFQTGDPAADLFPPRGDGVLNVNDLIEFVLVFTAGCPA